MCDEMRCNYVREVEILKFVKTNEPSKVARMNAAVHLVLIKAEGKLVNVYKNITYLNCFN